MNQKILKPITEAKYLTAENAWRYRSIMRSFYLFDQKYKHWVYKEDIHEALKKQEVFDDYSMELLRQDLDALVTWGNLNAVQDTTKVATFQQFVNKQYRYQMTEYAIEIERMTVRLENIFFEGGSLEPTLLERIKEQLKDLKGMVHEDDMTAGGWWSNLSADFQRLNQNYQDYIRDWYTMKAEEMMKTRSFLVYKEKLIEYLRNFIKELQQHAHEIEYVLRQISGEENRVVIERVIRYEQSIPRLDMDEISTESLRENIEGKYDSLLGFFLGKAGAESEVEKILGITNEIIRRITRYAASILEMSNQFSNRREEYNRMAALFSTCGDLDEAHILSAQIFGISAYKHFQGGFVRETESINSSIFDERPLEVITDPRVRTYRERIEKTAIQDKTAYKKAMREQVLKERLLQKEILDQYTSTGCIDFKALKDIEPFVRTTLLRWLAKAIQEKGRTTVTEHGQKFWLKNPEEHTRCTISCVDGTLEMPSYILEFEVNTNA